MLSARAVGGPNLSSTKQRAYWESTGERPCLGTHAVSAMTRAGAVGPRSREHIAKGVLVVLNVWISGELTRRMSLCLDQEGGIHEHCAQRKKAARSGLFSAL